MSDTLKVAELDEVGRGALRRLVLSLADSKRLMGIRYSDWLLGAPTVESGIAASSMCQDEWGHSRLLYSMLKELDIDPVSIEHDRDASEYASVGALDAEFSDWAAVVAGIVVIDGALVTALESFSRGSFEPAQQRVPKMLAEEAFHDSLGRAWYRRLAGSSEEAQGLLKGATEAMLPVVLRWLGSNDDQSTVMIEAGVIEDGQTLVASFKDSVRELLAEGGVDVDAVEPAEGWDPVRGRGPGQPDDEAIERVRGDRNRALFVE